MIWLALVVEIAWAVAQVLPVRAPVAARRCPARAGLAGLAVVAGFL